MDLYFGFIYKNQYGEFLVRKVGYKEIGRPIVMFSSLGLRVEEGLYLMERMNFPERKDYYFDLGIPVYPVRKLLSLSDCQLKILGDSYLDDYTKIKESDKDNSISELDFFLNSIAYPIDELLSLDSRFRSVSRVMYQLKTKNPQAFQINFFQNLRDGAYDFKDIIRYAVTPILPSLENAKLVPAIAKVRDGSQISTFYDLNVPLFESTHNHLVTIRTEEDFEKWSKAFDSSFHAYFRNGACSVYFNKDMASKEVGQYVYLYTYYGSGINKEIRVQFVKT